MLRIHFTVEDLACSRMVAGLGPMIESIFALEQFGHGDDALFDPWRARVHAELGDSAAKFTALTRQWRSVPEVLEILGPLRPYAGANRPVSRGQRYARALVEEFGRIAVWPYWTHIQRHLAEVRDVRGRTVIANGIERMLSALHPKLYWNAPTLEIHHRPERDVHPAGQGLVLSPSFFLNDKRCVFVDAGHVTSQAVLAFPVNATMKPELWETVVSGRQELGDLVGHTRAAALVALTGNRTTGELAQHLGISLAGASKHAAVLRRSGLITTARHRNTAVHELTALGHALLRGRVLSAQPFVAEELHVARLS